MKKLTKILTYLFFLLVALTAIVLIGNALSNRGQVGNSNNNDNDISSTDEGERNTENQELFSASGEVVCLAVANLDEPHNDLCKLGLRDDNNNSYALKSISENKFNVVNKVELGQEIAVTGIFINEGDDTYITTGTIEVNSINFLGTDGEAKNYYLPVGFEADYSSFQNYGSAVFPIDYYKMPGLSIVNGEIECEETNNLDSSLAPRTIVKVIKGHKYCIQASSEGAAGSVYTEYAYTTVKGDSVYLVRFIAHDTNCGNYPEEERVKCEAERETLDLDILVDNEISRISE